MNLDKEKQRFIKRFRTNNFGLNRILEWKKWEARFHIFDSWHSLYSFCHYIFTPAILCIFIFCLVVPPDLTDGFEYFHCKLNAIFALLPTLFFNRKANDLIFEDFTFLNYYYVVLLQIQQWIIVCIQINRFVNRGTVT